MRRRVAIAVLVCLSWHVHGGPMEDQTFAAFESVCLAPQNTPEQIPAIIAAVALAELPKQQAEMFLSPQRGRAWAIRVDAHTFVAMVSEAGACGILAPDANAIQVRDLLVRLVRTRLLSTRELGSDRQEVYAVTYPSRTAGAPVHALVTVDLPRLASARGARMVAIPERVLINDGARSPAWP